MRVGLLTTWSTQCGLAQYSRYLAPALERAGVEVTILGSRNYGARETGETTDLTVVPCFGVAMWNGGQDGNLDVEKILALDLDVVHCEYQCTLFHRGRLQQLLDGFQGVSAITFHDNAIPPDMPGPWDLEFRHRQDTGPAGHVIPFGVENHPPLVRTFGLGRTREDVVRPICEAQGWRFESAATSEAAFGGQHWMSQAELHAWLREADAIVLWYPEAPMAGSSQAARTALAARRPVFVNDVSWFRDLPTNPSGSGLYKLPDSPEALEYEMARVLGNRYITDCSWDRVAALHIRDYERALAGRVAAPISQQEV